MAVNLKSKGAAELLTIDGIQVFVGQAGIKKTDHNDVTLMVLAPSNTVAGVFTQNRFCAAPVRLCQQHLDAPEPIRALVINTGNANAGTGQQGRDDALSVCRSVAAQIGCDAQQVLPFSTGVILEPLPVAKIQAALTKMKPDHWDAAAAAIMTTDTVPKAASRELMFGAHSIRATGIAKGAGMIHPNMATMLGFIATDAAIEQSVLQQLTQEIADDSFNAITVDGDTSTNDSFVIIATGRSAAEPIESVDSDAYRQLKTMLGDLALELAQAIVRDGEGATKFITVQVEQAASRAEARQVAYAIAKSPLVKTAFYASDPNLGRLLCAIGYAGVADLAVEQVRLYLDDVLVAENGGRAASYTEVDGQRVMAAAEITVRVQLQRGDAVATVYTCDFSPEYVHINADYRS